MACGGEENIACGTPEYWTGSQKYVKMGAIRNHSAGIGAGRADAEL